MTEHSETPLESEDVQKLLESLHGSQWHDTYDATEGPLEVTDTIIRNSEHNRDSQYTAVKVTREHDQDSYIGIDFLDYIYIGRFNPRNDQAESVHETLSSDDRFPFMETS